MQAGEGGRDIGQVDLAAQALQCRFAIDRHVEPACTFHGIWGDEDIGGGQLQTTSGTGVYRAVGFGVGASGHNVDASRAGCVGVDGPDLIFPPQNALAGKLARELGHKAFEFVHLTVKCNFAHPIRNVAGFGIYETIVRGVYVYLGDIAASFSAQPSVDADFAGQAGHHER